MSTALAGRYTIERELDRGGMATVFRAQDLRHQRPVALKVLDPELAAAIGPGRFLREIQIAARMQHPHIVPLFDSGQAAGHLFYVMPCIAGGSLRTRLEREKQLPIEEVLRIATEVAGALEHAHHQEVVHRDIKPENVLFDEGRALVADFGIARVTHAAGVETLTQTGLTLGTPAYMSPEQAAGGTVDARGDEYALACMVYEMLAGQPPFTGATAESIAHQHLAVPPQPVTNFRPTVTRALAGAIEKALAKSPADRYASVGAFAAALMEGARTPDREVSWWRRRGALAASVVVVALAVLLWQVVRPPPKVPEASPKPKWILLAGFAGPEGDHGLADGVQAIVRTDIDQSPLVRCVTDEQVRMALTMAEKPETTRVSEAIARELAYRNGIEAVLAGEVVRIGRRFSVLLRVVNGESGELIASLRRTASNEDDLIPTVGHLTTELLGSLRRERGAMVWRTIPTQGVTASFEAFQAARRSEALIGAGQNREALVAAREALRLDPDFALAWLWLYGAYWNLGASDSAAYALRQTAEHRHRLVGRSRFVVDAELALMAGDLPGAVKTYDGMLKAYPDHPEALVNRGVCLLMLGRFEEALRDHRRAAEVQPVAPSPIVLLNEAEILVCLDRLDEAKAVTERLPAATRRPTDLLIALAGERWSRLDSLATTLQREMRPGDQLHAWHVGFLGVTRAVRGSVRAAMEALAEAAALPIASQDTLIANVSARERLALAALCGQPAAPASVGPGEGDDHSSLVTRGMTLAAAGDMKGARDVLATLRARFGNAWYHTGATPELLKAWIARSVADWQGTIRSLAPPARGGTEADTDMKDTAGRPMMRWMVGEAFERLGRRDSAIAYYELALDRGPMTGSEWHQRAVLYSFLHQRLAVLHAGLGHVSEAERHLEILERDFTRPDPDVRHLLDEARAAVADARKRRQQAS